MKNSVLPVIERDHIRGPAAAPLTLLEYGDYECPYCAVAHDAVLEILNTCGDQVSYVFRNFPLVTVHPHAMRAAEAAEAAGAQGKFWEMHDLLFESQDDLDEVTLFEFAQRLGLNIGQFEEELLQHSHIPRIQEDFQTGIHHGVKGTPSFFINGIRYNGGYDAEALLEIIEETLEG